MLAATRHVHERMHPLADMIQHAYECQAKGHEGGSRTFLAAPPEWFSGKGISTPKNCPDCRVWVKSQTDEKIACACGAKVRISARAKISQFKKVGPYEPTTECRDCRDGKRPAKGAKRRPDRTERQKRKPEVKPTEFSSLRHGIPLQPRALLTSGSYYTSLRPGASENRLEHLGHHVPGSPYDLTTPEAAAASGQRQKSPSSFASEPSVERLLESAQAHVSTADAMQTREYMDGRRIVRVTYTGDHDRVEISILDPLPGDHYGLATTYDNVTVEDVMKETWYNGY